MTLNCIIVDDEPLSRMILKNYCEKSDGLHLKEEFENAITALAFMQANEIDIIFLDVEMPGINGFQMMDQLPYIPKIIMTTSKTDYAFSAFEYNVTDFLKKPVTYDRFQDSLEKVQSIYKNTLVSTTNKPDEIFIKSNGSHVRLMFSDILFIEGMGDYVKYVTTGKTYIAHSTLKAAAEKMNSDLFLKVHRSYIVNVEKVLDVTDNSIKINNTVIPVSKSNKAGLRMKLGIA